VISGPARSSNSVARPGNPGLPGGVRGVGEPFPPAPEPAAAGEQPIDDIEAAAAALAWCPFGRVEPGGFDDRSKARRTLCRSSWVPASLAKTSVPAASTVGNVYVIMFTNTRVSCHPSQ
jgi:hypothetical protein